MHVALVPEAVEGGTDQFSDKLAGCTGTEAGWGCQFRMLSWFLTVLFQLLAGVDRTVDSSARWRARGASSPIPLSVESVAKRERREYTPTSPTRKVGRDHLPPRDGSRGYGTWAES